MKSIGIDIGTTSICGVAVNAASGNADKIVTKPNTASIRSDKPFERLQDPEKIYKTVLDILDELDGANACSIGFSGQMHGILYIDENGDAASALFTWQDERANLEQNGGKSYADLIGCPSGYGLATDYYNRINSLVPENAVYLCTIADYVAMKLCSLKKPVMHISNAASLGRFDIVRNKFQIENLLLPRVTADFEAIGSCNSVPVSVALGDNQASFIGSVANPDDALLNVGTGAQISWLTNRPIESDEIETRPFDAERFLAAGCSLCGGRAYAMLERFFGDIAKLASENEEKSFYPILNKILESKTETSLVADCRFCGTRANPDIRGSISNISENNFTPADMALAVLDGMAEELCEMYKNGGGASKGLVCSGNGIRKNAALRRVVEQKFGVKIKIPLCGEEAAYGAALSSLVACGTIASISEACEKIKYN